MVSLRDQFQHFYAPGEGATASAMKAGFVVPDTNVLLNFYRYQMGARDELFGALEKLENRLWIPYQVGLEFHRRRLDVMAEQEGYFTKTRDEILAAIDGLHGKVRAFAARIGLSSDYVKKIEDGICELNGLIADEVMKAQGLNEVRLDGHASDKVLVRIDALFENRVGEPMKPEELADARAEAERRVKEKAPPGYKDKGKADSAGDYLIWRQVMMEAKERKLPVVFITDDTKEDWYQKYNGRTLGARRELREEMMSQAGVPLFIMTTETFLHHAGKYLNAEVSQETVDQARELPGLTPAQAPAPEIVVNSLAHKVAVILAIDGIRNFRSMREDGEMIVTIPDRQLSTTAEGQLNDLARDERISILIESPTEITRFPSMVAVS
jgi:hypothetical protein